MMPNRPAAEDRAAPLILDSTLREGEQTPGVSFTVDEKVSIARLLDAFGVDIIEAGHPAVSPEVRAGVRAVVQEGLEASVLAHSRALRDDIDLVLSTGADWIGLFFCVRDAALEARFRRDIDAAERLVVDAVQYAVDHGLRVRYTPEDTVRSDFAKVVRIANAAVEAGAERISIADTCGAMDPFRMHRFVSDLRAQVTAPLNVHCHNDLGLAVANSLAAWQAGVSLVDTCVNGLGERCGITDLAAFTTALETLHGVGGHDLTMLPEISETVARYARLPVAVQAPVVGRTAFSHNAGLHVAAVLLDPSHYENIPAARVGRERELVLDRFAGLPTVRFRLARLGVTTTDEEAGEVLRLIKQAESGLLDDQDLARLWQRATGRTIDAVPPGPAIPAPTPGFAFARTV